MSPEATFKAAVHEAIDTMRANTPPMQFWTAAAQQAAEDECVEAITEEARRAFAQGALFDASEVS